MHHVLRCWERQSDGSEYKETLRRPGFCPGPRWGSLQRSRKPPSWWGGAGCPLPKNPIPRSGPFGPRLFYPHSKISSDAVASLRKSREYSNDFLDLEKLIWLDKPVEVCESTRTRGYTRPDPYPRVRVGSGSWNARPAHLYKPGQQLRDTFYTFTCLFTLTTLNCR